MQHLRRAGAALLLWTGFATANAADFKIAVEPAYPPDQAQDIYKPLLDYLAASTGHTFQLVVARNYHFHWRDLQKNMPVDFAFEEAHFADYRMSHQQFEPLVRTAEPTAYALLTQPDYEAGGLKGLIGRPVACMPAPSLGFALLTELYNNPVAQPDIRSEAPSWQSGVEMMFGGESDGAMVPSYLADLYPNLVILNRSRNFPGRAVTVAPGVDAQIKQAVKDALLKLHENPEAYGVLGELGASKFEPATRAEYTGNERMLEGFFGYTKAGAAPVEAPAAAEVPPATQ